MNDKQVLLEVAKALEINVDQTNFSVVKEVLTGKINELIKNDFHRLVSILYRVDVSEPKLRQMLKEQANTDAAIIITDLLIERLQQKLRSRQEYKPDQNISDDEKW